MLPVPSSNSNIESIRFSKTDVLDLYMGGDMKRALTEISRREALEEQLFLGLRLNRGIDYRELESQLDRDTIEQVRQLVADGLLEFESNLLRLTSRGRLLSNEVFEQFITAEKL
jgi:oxygen-independent coproporphyrinogen-3 oxidase